MKKWLVAGLGVVALAGCSSSNTAGLRIDSASQQVLYSDSALDDDLSINSIDTQENNGNTRGLVKITNNSQDTQTLQYRFYWYDDQGLEVNAKQGAWRQFVLRGYESITLSEVSVNPNATDFRIQIRPQD
ncbi:YcfL family protein [Vibrio rumoiensis]|uniref:YcfL family protein n=1 Tax=Vibrio rumoiensis TaxID=76258 RepID=A0ABW7IUS7_9VIBR|nr:YcfL family protein [Vibrio rumoiensis]